MQTTSQLSLRTSWTKYDVVQIIELIANNEIENCFNGTKAIHQSIIKSVLGVDSIHDELPNYWKEIYKHPRQLRLFALIATLFIHEDNIRRFAEKYSLGNMRGVYLLENGKLGTNIRRALVISGASLENYSRAKEVPYDFSSLFENGSVGLLMQQVLENRLLGLGYTYDSINTEQTFFDACIKVKFHKALSLSSKQFKKWIKGTKLTEEDLKDQFKQLSIYKEVQGIKVNQWLNDWDDIDFKSPLREKPEPYFALVSIDARLLKRISDVHRRKAEDPASTQRARNNSRIREISKYIEGGFPWSTLNESEQISIENQGLKMPGFLPTAIIGNILGPDQERNGKTIKNEDLIKIESRSDGGLKIVIPDNVFEDGWNPDVKPIEIIDGQHRLWAFDETESLSGNYELPLIIFNNLDRAWQAYLFYTINIKPVKINTSLGYDLYPLLRTQEWLEKSKDGILAYRETRAQEIVGALWSYNKSPWYQRINMIGDTTGLTMSQSAFVKTLSNTFFRRSKSLYGSELSGIGYKFINWNRPQQSAFIIYLWQSIAEQLKNSKEEWAVQVRNQNTQLKIDYLNEEYRDLAFIDKNSFLSRDQGVRAISSVANDFFFLAASYGDIDFNKFYWEYELDDSDIRPEDIEIAIAMFRKDKDFESLINKFCKHAVKVDWRTISAPFSTENEREIQKKYKGSGGYKEFRQVLINVLINSQDELVKRYAKQIE